MNLLALVALLLGIAGWTLAGLTGMHLLSGYLEERSCQTDCVQTLFFSAVATGLGALIISGLSLLRPHGRVLSLISLLLAAGLCAVFAVLFITGNMG